MPASTPRRTVHLNARRGVDAFLARVSASITSDMVSGRPLRRARGTRDAAAPFLFVNLRRARAQVQSVWLGVSVGLKAAQVAFPAAAIDTSLGTAPHPAVGEGVTGLSEAFQTSEALAAAWVGAQAEADAFAERLGDEKLLDTSSLHRCASGLDVDSCASCGSTCVLPLHPGRLCCPAHSQAHVPAGIQHPVAAPMRCASGVRPPALRTPTRPVPPSRKAVLRRVARLPLADRVHQELSEPQRQALQQPQNGGGAV